MKHTTLRQLAAHNCSTFRRQPLTEISGSLGDLGTFLPIVIALTEGHQISLTTTLIFTGLYNILTGAFFGIPLPVQPMKAIAAVAILKSLTAGQTAAAGIFVSSCILAFSVTGLLSWFTRVIPIPVVKGIQVGAGLSLIIAAGTKALSSLSWTSPSWADNYLWMILAFLALFATNLRPRTPYALMLFVIGIVFAIIRLTRDSHRHLPGFQLWHPYTQVPSGEEWKTGIFDAGVGQLPLTTLNSIIAVTHLAADLLPDIQTPSVTSVGISVAAMNLFGCWFGAMPVCHGSGGLAAQYRFGARSGASIIFLGLLKLILGILFGESLANLLTKFPLALLSVMIVAAGLELASVGESLNTPRARDLTKEGDDSANTVHITDDERKKRWTIMLVTAGLLVGFKNDAVGFLGGMFCHWSYQVPRYVAMLRSKSSRTESTHPEEQESLLPQ
ncbi:SulP family sulfate permease [Exophiala viscosa]|uniref:SulP family sulfate permease n=1 Tax=Exophiala viscosa TaxID=2486360 RepID=A0AAN6DX72_9EURO|nr:SulP family sulfate permease [Exophiala viscosa]